jgi:hypothetical protein
MNSAKPLRLRAPAIMITGGAGLTAAVAAAYGWGAAIPIAVIAVVAAAGYYIWGGRDSDTGAMVGSRVDERQSLLRMRAQSLGGLMSCIAALVGYMVAVALKDPVWPFALILGTGAAGFIAGLAIYGRRLLGIVIPRAGDHRSFCGIWTLICSMIRAAWRSAHVQTLPAGQDRRHDPCLVAPAHAAVGVPSVRPPAGFHWSGGTGCAPVRARPPRCGSWPPAHPGQRPGPGGRP